MPKLTRQQTIILSIMVVVVLYGLYDFIIVPKTKSVSSDVGKKPAELEAFVADITAKMSKGFLSSNDAYTINSAETEWIRDPFYEKKSFRDWRRIKDPKAGKDAGSDPGFNYSGYLSIGNKKMAIINGVEYESGDHLEIEGYVVEKIYPDRVVIINIKSRSEFEVSLQE